MLYDLSKLDEIIMKENAYLLNCRANLVVAGQMLHEANQFTEGLTTAVYTAQQRVIQAIQELDAFRHGALQKCDQCSDMSSNAEEGP